MPITSSEMAYFGALELDANEIRDIRPDVLDQHGRIRVLPAAYWATTTVKERALFGVRTGTYSFPTVELVAHLRALIAGRPAIEIGAGHGALAEALGIPATDSFQQRQPAYAAHYAQIRQPTVPYGPNVVEMHASRAVRHYRPEVVVGAWITHKFDPAQAARGGNPVGVDEPDILRHCAEYVLVGNQHVHAQKPIWARQHTVEFPSYVYSRAHNGSRELIAIFPGYKHAR